MILDPSRSVKCCWPLGSSEAVAVVCALPEGHDGEHCSSFELLPDKGCNDA